MPTADRQAGDWEGAHELAERIQEVAKEHHLGSEIVHELRDLSLNVPARDCVAVMGVSGAGKSILLNLPGCLDQPSSGTILLGDVNVAKIGYDGLLEIRASWTSFVFQS